MKTSILFKVASVIVLGLGLISCQGCHKPDKTVNPPPNPSATVPAPVPTTQKITFNNLTAEVPLGWEKQEDDPSNLTFLNKTDKIMVFFEKRECLDDYNKCMIATLKDIVDSGVDVENVADGSVNGEKFILIASSKDPVKLWSWVFAHGTNIYMVSCGGLKTATQNEAVCKKIVSSVIFK